MTESITLDAMQKHYEQLAIQLEEELPDFEYLTLCLDANFGTYEFCTGSLGLDLYLYTELEYIKVDLGEVKLISKADLLQLWNDTKLGRYTREAPKAKPPSTGPKVTLSLDDLGL